MTNLKWAGNYNNNNNNPICKAPECQKTSVALKFFGSSEFQAGCHVIHIHAAVGGIAKRKHTGY